MRRILLVLLGILSIAAGGWWYAIQGPKLKEAPKTIKVDERIQEEKDSSGRNKGVGGADKGKTCVVSSLQAKKQGKPVGKNNDEYQYDQLTSEQEQNMLDLIARLDEDNDLRVRDKIVIASYLGGYADPRSVKALKRLVEEDASETLDDEIIYVATIAQRSLDAIKSTHDMRQLTPDSPLAEQLEIIRKYTDPDHEGNTYADRLVKFYVIKQASANPHVFVPLLVELYPGNRETEKMAKLYPELADESILRNLESSDEDQVERMLGLIRELERKKFLARIYDIVFDGEGNFPPSEEFSNLRRSALVFFGTSGSEGVQYLEKVLYNSQHYRNKEVAINQLVYQKTSEARSVLKKYIEFHSNKKVKDEKISKVLIWAAKKIEREQ